MFLVETIELVEVGIPQYGFPGTWTLLFVGVTEVTPDGQVVATGAVTPTDLGLSADQGSFTNTH